MALYENFADLRAAIQDQYGYVSSFRPTGQQWNETIDGVEYRSSIWTYATRPDADSPYVDKYCTVIERLEPGTVMAVEYELVLAA
jgi:hypothetical protein